MPPYISLYLPHISAISPSYLRYISQALHEPEAISDATLYLPISPSYLPYISQALHEPEAISDAALLATALDCLEHLCERRTEP